MEITSSRIKSNEKWHKYEYSPIYNVKGILFFSERKTACTMCTMFKEWHTALLYQNHTSIHFRMVSFDIICLETDISTTMWWA